VLQPFLPRGRVLPPILEFFWWLASFSPARQATGGSIKAKGGDAPEIGVSNNSRGTEAQRFLQLQKNRETLGVALLWCFEEDSLACNLAQRLVSAREASWGAHAGRFTPKLIVCPGGAPSAGHLGFFLVRSLARRAVKGTCYGRRRWALRPPSSTSFA